MEKLDRSHVHKINAHQGDRIYLWESPIHSDRQNLTVQDNNGNDVLTVFAITHDQLASLYLEIGSVLGKSPNPTVHHLKQVRDRIDSLIQKAEPSAPTTGDDTDFGDYR